MADRDDRFEDRMERFVEDIMATIQDLQAKDAELGAQVTAIVSDVDKLLALIKAGTTGLSPADQATLDATVASVQGQIDALKGEDLKVNPAPPPPPGP